MRVGRKQFDPINDSQSNWPTHSRLVDTDETIAPSHESKKERTLSNGDDDEPAEVSNWSQLRTAKRCTAKVESDRKHWHLGHNRQLQLQMKRRKMNQSG